MLYRCTYWALSMHVDRAYLDASLPPCHGSPGLEVSLLAESRHFCPRVVSSLTSPGSCFPAPDSRLPILDSGRLCAKWRAFCGRDDHSSCRANWLTVCAISGAANLCGRQQEKRETYVHMCVHKAAKVRIHYKPNSSFIAIRDSWSVYGTNDAQKIKWKGSQEINYKVCALLNRS